MRKSLAVALSLVFLDVAGAINSAVGDVKSQIKSIMNVVFPFLTGILGIVFVVVLIWQGVQYRRQQDINWTLLIILLICLVLCGGGATLAYSLGGW